MKDIKNIYDSYSMLANLDRVIRQLRRQPKGTRHIPRGTYRLLRTISENPGLSTGELIEVLDIRRTSLNEKLMRLENEGIIKRERDSKDQRVSLIYLEQAGMDYLAKSQETRSKKNDAISKILSSEEIHELAYLSGKLADGLKQMDMENRTD